MKKNNNVNLIKFIAAILVVFSHSFAIAKNDIDFLGLYSKEYITLGAVGVSIFFTLSGYFITNSLIKNGDKDFIKKRFKKIFPPLWIVVFITIFILGPLLTTTSLSNYFTNKKTFLYLLNALMIPYHSLPGVFSNNIFGDTINGALWTLIVEFLCYIFILIIYKIKLLKKNKYYVVFIILIILSFICSLLFKNINFVYSMIRPFQIFNVGVLLYLYQENKINKNLFISSFIFGLACIIINTPYSFDAFLVFSLPIMLMFLCLNIKQTNELISNLGIFSYEMYLIGFPIQQTITYLFGGKMNIYLNFIISIVLDIIFGYILYKFTNNIMKRYKK